MNSQAIAEQRLEVQPKEPRKRPLPGHVHRRVQELYKAPSNIQDPGPGPPKDTASEVSKDYILFPPVLMPSELQKSRNSSVLNKHNLRGLSPEASTIDNERASVCKQGFKHWSQHHLSPANGILYTLSLLSDFRNGSSLFSSSEMVATLALPKAKAEIEHYLEMFIPFFEQLQNDPTELPDEELEPLFDSLELSVQDRLSWALFGQNGLRKCFVEDIVKAIQAMASDGHTDSQRGSLGKDHVQHESDQTGKHTNSEHDTKEVHGHRVDQHSDSTKSSRRTMLSALKKELSTDSWKFIHDQMGQTKRRDLFCMFEFCRVSKISKTCQCFGKTHPENKVKQNAPL